MKMNKTLLAILAMSSVASVAHADISIMGNEASGVQVYGILDSAAGQQQHSYGADSQFPGTVVPVGPYKLASPTNPVRSVNGLFNGGISPSRLGIKGNTDIADGIKAFFVLETGFDLPTGKVSNAAACLASNTGVRSSDCANSSIDGQPFNRQAFVGLSEKTLGSLQLGRNYAPIFDVTNAYDPVQNAQLFSPLGFSGTFGGGGGVSEDTRVDNSLKYANKIGAFNFGGMVKLGSTAGSDAAKSANALNAGYEDGAFGVQAAYEIFKDAKKGNIGVLANTVSVQVSNTKAFMIAAKYKVTNEATVKVGYETYTMSAPSDAMASTISGFYGQNVSGNTNFSGPDQTTHIVWLGGDYNFTPKFNLSAGIYEVSPQQALNAAGTGVAQASGTQLYTSLLADYHFTKAFDAYAGMMHVSFSGDAYPATTFYQSNLITAVGARFKF